VTAVLLLVSYQSLTAEAYLGGTLRAQVSSLVDPADPIRSSLYTVLSAALSVQAGSDVVDGEIHGRVDVDYLNEDVSAHLDSATLDAYFGSHVLLRAGWFIYNRSVADVLRILDVFTRTDFEAYFQGRLDQASMPSVLFQTSVVLGPAFVRMTVQPVILDVGFLDVDSIWFPDTGVPDQINVRFPSAKTIYRSEIVIDDYPAPTGALEEVSFAAEAGGSLGPVDLFAIYYHGQDMRPLFTATLEFPNGLFADFRARLTPVYRTIDAIGGAMITVFGPVRVYTEQMYRFSDSILTEAVTVSETGFKTLIHESPTYRYTVGTSYENYRLSLVAAVEFTDTTILDPVTRMVEPFLDRALAVLLQWSGFDGRLSLTGMGLMSLPDKSLVTTARIEVTSLDQSLAGALVLPLFWGGADTELGQYHDNIFPTVSLTFRF
jgi:hypothetical protein